MKIHHYLLSICIATVVFLAGCLTQRDNNERHFENAVLNDSLFQSTGNALLDSLLHLAAISPRDTSLVMLYDKIGDIYKNSNPAKAKEIYTISGALSEQLDWNVGRFLYFVNIANQLIREGISDSALVLLTKGNELANRVKNEKWKANFAINFGNVYVLKQWYTTALNKYLEALPYFEQVDNRKMTGEIYHNISQVYAMMNLVEKAIEYSEKAVALNNEDPYALFHLGRAYGAAHEFEKSNVYYQKSIEICKRQNFTYLLGFLYYQSGDNSLNTCDLKNVERYGRMALDIFRDYGDEANIAFPILLLSKLEKLKGDFIKSEKYALEIMQIAEKLDMPDIKRECYMILSELTTAQRRYRDNIEYWKEMDLIEKTIANETSIRASAEMEAKYENAKKELEIKQQQLVIARQNMQRSLLAAGVAVCVVFLALLWYMLRLRIRRNHALAEMNATKDKFFSIISHDLKNPAIAQRDAIQMLVKNARFWDVDALTGYYDSLLKSAEGQVELIYNLLGWAQIQTGRMNYTPSTFNLTARLREEVALIRKMAETKGITINVQMPEEAPVTGDSNMLATVIRNLLTNAVKFTAPGGQVALDITSPTPSLPRREGEREKKLSSPNGGDRGGLIVTVSDTGTGMSHEQMRNLFRIDSLQSRQGTAGEQGSGLGLIVCKELLEKHGSVLQVESEEGKGSRFWFSL